jgi:poly-gamma-glutamate synthesis protein (capsule biosynthesis protein)
MRYSPASVYGDLLPTLGRADLRIVNCECALTTRGAPVWKSGAVFKGEPAHAAALTAVPFDVACLANNHVLDYGVAGLRETLRVLDRHGIRTVGAGLTEQQAYTPLTCRANDLTIHIVNFSEGEDLTAAHGGSGVFGWDIPRVVSLVRRFRKGRGRVIAIGHCGLEYVPHPPPYVVAAFRAIIDAGADCVVGHHPHVPQGIEWYRDRPIVYSLGNFAFYQQTELYWRKIGAAVTIRLNDRGLSGLDVHPYRITDTGLRALDRREEASFRRTLARLSRDFGKPGGPERAWQAYLAHYGEQGLRAEVLGILEKMEAEPPKGAAMFRNRITTMQHVELWRDVLTRTIAKAARSGLGQTGLTNTPDVGRGPAGTADARRLVEEYFTRTVTG